MLVMMMNNDDDDDRFQKNPDPFMLLKPTTKGETKCYTHSRNIGI
jgi:hypothetical protein